MNYNWVWGPDNPVLDKAASLSMTLRDADPGHLAALLTTWLDGLSFSPESDHYFWGGWSVRIVDHHGGSAELVFTSGGQDVAESLGDGVDSFYEQVLHPLSTASVVWTELPLN